MRILLHANKTFTNVFFLNTRKLILSKTKPILEENWIISNHQFGFGIPSDYSILNCLTKVFIFS